MKSKYIGNTYQSKYGVIYTVLKKVSNSSYEISVEGMGKVVVDRDVVRQNSLLSIAKDLGIAKGSRHGVDVILPSTRMSKSAIHKWEDMLDRCYKPNSKDISYVECIVCDEWLVADNFGKWFDTQVGHDLGWELDKDILERGNNIYHPDKCCLVPKEVNLFFRSKKNKGNGLPSGVWMDREYYATSSQVFGVEVRKLFKTVEEAETWYIENKIINSKLLVEKYKDLLDSRVLIGIENYFSS